MRNRKLKTNTVMQCSIAALSLLFLSVPAHGQAPAQVPVPLSPGAPGPELQVQSGPAGGFSVAFNDKVEVVKGHGYQADAVTETVQTLADGSHIMHKMTAAVARDAEGRTMRSETLDGMGLWGSAADQKQVKITMVFDPVAGTHTHWQSDSKIATVMPMPPHMGAVGNSFFSTSAGPGGGIVSSAGVVTDAGVVPSGGFTTRVVAGGGPMPPDAGPDTVVVHKMQNLSDQAEKPDAGLPNETTEQLGTRMVEGVEAVGTKVTQVIPAGAIGNDKELVSTRETWFSPELKVVVMSVRNDPRIGQIRYTLSNIQVAEPDPSIFQPPAGYSVLHPRAPGN
jgi:hypothetical protein